MIPTLAQAKAVALARRDKLEAAIRTKLTAMVALRLSNVAFPRTNVSEQKIEALRMEVDVAQHDLSDARRSVDVIEAEIRAERARREIAETYARTSLIAIVSMLISVASMLATWWGATHH